MLAKGKAYISIDELKQLFDLPEDSEIVNVSMLDDGIDFHIISKEPIEGKTVVAKSTSLVRRFRVDPFANWR